MAVARLRSLVTVDRLRIGVGVPDLLRDSRGRGASHFFEYLDSASGAASVGEGGGYAASPLGSISRCTDGGSQSARRELSAGQHDTGAAVLDATG